jgi:hypothetical protein
VESTPRRTHTPILASLRTRVRTSWPVGLVVLAAFVSQYAAVLWAGPTRVLANPDVQLHYWTLWWWAEALRHDPWRVWDAPQFAPYPATLAFSDHLAPLGIVAAPLLWLGVPIAVVLQAAVVGSAAATIWAVYQLARAYGATQWPALLVGISAACGAYRVTQLAHLQMQATWLLPIAVIWLRAALVSQRWFSGAALGFVAVCAAAFGLSVYHGFMLLPVVALVGVVTVWQQPNRWTALLRFAGLGVVGGLAALPSLLPYVRVQQTTAASRSLEELANWSAPLQAWVAVPADHPVWPRLLGEAVTGRPELTLAPGLLLAVGALLAMRVPAARRSVWLLVVAAGVVLASGTTLRIWDGDRGIALPFARWLAALPGFGALRVPARWGWLVVCGLAPLAALGWGWLAQRRSWWWLPAAVCLVLDLSWPQATYLATPQPTTVPAVINWLAAQPGAPKTMLELPLKPQVETTVQAERLWWQTLHRQRSVTGYSGLAPATQVLLARDAAHLPRADVLARITALGVERIVVYRTSREGVAAAAAVARCPTCRVMYDEADALVVALPPSALVAPPLRPGQVVWISADARLPDLVAFGLQRFWDRAGVTVTGAARERFSPALPGTTNLPDAWLLGTTEEPESVGMTPADAVVSAAGATRYARPADLLAAQPVATPSGHVVVRSDDSGVWVGESLLAASDAATVTVVFDVAVRGAVTIAGQRLAPGAQTLALAVQRGAAPLQLVWEPAQAALVRVRVYAGNRQVPPLQSVPFVVESEVDGAALRIAGDVDDVQLQGIEAGSGKAVTHALARQTRRIAVDTVPSLQPGHYQVVCNAPHGQRTVVANLWIDGSGWRWQAIPVALTLVY